MVSLKVHFIHVGNMNNKGTQGLLKSDISVIKDVVESDATFSVSTTDMEGVKRLNLCLEAVLPPMVDIPYEKADEFARKFGCSRDSFMYKSFAIACLIYMFPQAVLSVISAVLTRLRLKGFYRSEVLEHMKDCNVIVSYSDENFKEEASLLPLNIYWIATWWSMLFSRTWDILIAKLLGKRVVMFPNSVGPFRTLIGRFLSRLALNNCDCILVREPISNEVINSLGIRSPKILVSDTALLFNSAHKVSLDKSSNPVVGVSPGFYSHIYSEKEAYRYVAIHAKALDIAIEKYGLNVVFLPHYVSGFRNDDYEICKLILLQMKNKRLARIADIKTVEEFKSFSDQMDMVISSKLHPAVIAAAGYVPTLCIAYDQKQIGFFQSLDLTDCIIPIREFSCEELSLKIDYVWNNKDQIRALLKERVPLLQKSVRKAVEYALTCFAEVEQD